MIEESRNVYFSTKQAIHRLLYLQKTRTDSFTFAPTYPFDIDVYLDIQRKPTSRQLRLLAVGFARLFKLDDSEFQLIDSVEQIVDEKKIDKDIAHHFRSVRHKDEVEIEWLVFLRRISLNSTWSGEFTAPYALDQLLHIASNIKDKLLYPEIPINQQLLDLIDDIAGDPFIQYQVPPITPDIEGILDELINDRPFLDPIKLSILADALEDSSYYDQVVLDHLRNKQALHIYGCRAVDLILERINENRKR